MPPEIIAILNDCKIAEWMIGSVLDPYEKLYSEVSGWVRTVLDAANGAPIPAFPMIPAWPALPPSTTIVAGIDVRRIAWVERCKSSTNYTPGVIGVALRTEPTGTPFDPMTWQAKIRSLECTGPAQVRLKLAKASGEVDANAVYSRRKGQTVWTKLGVFTQAEITDTTPCAVPGQPEEREYLVRSVIKDEEIGLASDIETVIVRGERRVVCKTKGGGRNLAALFYASGKMLNGAAVHSFSCSRIFASATRVERE